MKNKLIDLNNHLFAQLERLGDEDLSPEEIKLEIGRSKEMSNLGHTIIDNAALAFKVKKHQDDVGFIDPEHSLPAMLEVNKS
jgi:hypothetical protein